MLSKFGSAPGRHFRDAMHINWTADRRGQLAAGAFERNDDIVRAQLRIIDHLFRPAHCAERHVDSIEDRVPVRHRLRAEDFVENGRELRHVRDQLRRIGEPRIGQEIRAADRFRHGRQLVRSNKKNEPGVVGGPIHIHRRICRIFAIVRGEKLHRKAPPGSRRLPTRRPRRAARS